MGDAAAIAPAQLFRARCGDRAGVHRFQCQPARLQIRRRGSGCRLRDVPGQHPPTRLHHPDRYHRVPDPRRSLDRAVLSQPVPADHRRTAGARTRAALYRGPSPIHPLRLRARPGRTPHRVDCRNGRSAGDCGRPAPAGIAPAVGSGHAADQFPRIAGVPGLFRFHRHRCRSLPHRRRIAAGHDRGARGQYREPARAFAALAIRTDDLHAWLRSRVGIGGRIDSGRPAEIPLGRRAKRRDGAAVRTLSAGLFRRKFARVLDRGYQDDRTRPAAGRAQLRQARVRWRARGSDRRACSPAAVRDPVLGPAAGVDDAAGGRQPHPVPPQCARPGQARGAVPRSGFRPLSGRRRRTDQMGHRLLHDQRHDALFQAGEPGRPVAGLSGQAGRFRDHSGRVHPAAGTAHAARELRARQRQGDRRCL